ncbi:hypothetical protein Poli38472_001677 [Pythium oligandrum]|uniref:Inhibitor of growth protein n=1 Tax=Pythium oligandrum TaxID=41045 RepID=A0A8K1CVS9_PYTOL|nr:hypothetical protein Poli38472_001677 [Pythium oligandrum]|eukprot:TMW69521.1 hypothetical protein Poli38472_001677 [Pythium oligandrum]
MGTYLEDYLESMYMLPSEVKRNFDLMRELDKTSYPLIEELQAYHKEYLVSARKKVVERCANTELGEPDETELRELVETDEALEKLREKHQRVIQKLDEKIAIAAQSYDLVDHHIRRLDQDLEAYATLLKQNGEFEDDKVQVKKRKLSQAGVTDGTIKAETTKQLSGQSSSGAGASAAAVVVTQQQQSTSRKSGSSSSSGRKRSATTETIVEVPVAAGGALAGAVPLATDDLPIDPNEPIYCHCRRVSYGQMVGCDNDDCKYEWFHFECVGLTDQPQGTWYCNDCKVMLGIK